MTREEKVATAARMYQEGASINAIRRACRHASGDAVRAFLAAAGVVYDAGEVGRRARAGAVARGRALRQRTPSARPALVRRDDGVTLCPTVYLVPLWAGRVHGAARAAMGR